MKVIAFAPGHISGFFEPVYHTQDTSRSGSRGAGINLSLGALSEVYIEHATTPQIDVLVNNKVTGAPTTKLAVTHLLGSRPLHVTIKTELGLPVGQGFGMSAAGALSASYAVAKLLEQPLTEAMKAAHTAEVQLRTGLGDVIASCFGGIEIRKQPGLPPWGLIEHIPGACQLVLCVIGKRIDTRKILSDASRMNDIVSYGKYCTKKLLENPSLKNLFSLSYLFTTKTGLATDRVLQAIEAANHVGMASMCMLGNAVFAMGETDNLVRTLSVFGKVCTCASDTVGTRLVEG
ncbi:MAG: GHMP kinase [Candidatus Thermoplasmatota archaeon]|nr:GHMP kinase [Candidatus Thermoplasmatota archaeon]